MSNPWVTYIDRSYSYIKASILRALDTQVPELTDRSPSNLLIVIGDMFAGIAEMINYYIDITARELFLPTARRLSSVIKLAKLVNYNGKARTASHATVTFTAENVSNVEIVAPTAFTIDAGTILSDINGNKWVTQHDQVFREGYSTTVIAVVQYVEVLAESLGSSDGTVSQSFALPTSYRDSSLVITVNSVNWELVESFGFSAATDKHCVVKMLEDGAMYVEFGDGVNGAIPVSAQVIYADYQSTEGPEGNASKDTITTIDTTLVTPSIDHLSVTNAGDGYGGREIEGIEEIRRAIPIALRTLNRAVTKKDYEDVAILSSDIRAARVVWDCGARVEMYLVSHGGGNPPQSILDATKTFVEARSLMTIELACYPSGETHIRGEVSIVGRFRALASVISTKTYEALQELYNPYTSTINQDIRLSDIIAAIDNITEVDYLSLDSIYAQPYLRPSNPAAAMEYSIVVLAASTIETNWSVKYDPAGDALEPYFIYKEGNFLVKMAAGTTETSVGDLLNVTITSCADMVQDDTWAFVVYPYNQDINLNDLSIPIIGPDDFTINVQQTYVSI